jgi:putative transposase
VSKWAEQTDISTNQFIAWLGIGVGKFYSWRQRYGKVNEHNGSVPRDHWLQASEKQAILNFHAQHPLDGYRRLTYRMIDLDIVAASPTTVYRVLHQAGVLARFAGKPSKKGSGFQQPEQAHQHWHTDITYVNIQGTFYYLSVVLDGFSRFIVAWDLKISMVEADIEITLQRALEAFPDAKPRIVSDNGPQYVSKDFKEFIRVSGMTHVRTSPYYPQSNGKLERFNGSIKREAIRPATPASLEDGLRIVGNYVQHYNTERLHSATGYVTPKDMLEGRQKQIWDERDRKLDTARERRAQLRQAARAIPLPITGLSNNSAGHDPPAVIH